MRLVALPGGVDPASFAERARLAGADVLEVAEPPSTELSLPVLRPGAQRPGERIAGKWAEVVSFSSAVPLTPDEAVACWANVSAPFITHLEPEPDARLLKTQARLIDRFGAGRVTVLASGPYAAAWSAVLAERNALDPVALDADDASAGAGRRLLRDAVRTAGATGPRLAIIGAGIAASWSPRVHPQPFDRWELPPEAPVAALVEQLRAHYRGFVITSPFKRRFTSAGAINTLVRRPVGWLTANTDVDAARFVLDRHQVRRPFTVLGDGGAAHALREAGAARVLARANAGLSLGGDVFWTWPAHVPAPPGLRLDAARVFVIAYGAPARQIARRIGQLGGRPVRVGPAWFVAQARAQRALWRHAQ